MLCVAIDVGILNLAVCVTEDVGGVPVVRACEKFAIGRGQKEPINKVLDLLVALMEARQDAFRPANLTQVVIEQQCARLAVKNFAIASALYALYVKAGVPVRFVSPREKFKVLAAVAAADPSLAHLDFSRTKGRKSIKQFGIDLAQALARKWECEVLLQALASNAKLDDICDAATMAFTECVKCGGVAGK
ncbi:hypothetical protein JKP88DRAFT_157254 [Tribonema minus]|uniref:Uncharacterized protein n=1 Tax=Tribonema minus TaxID=303371 RepID=A0A835YWP7_9STRA|nr:hypothetical protein JKP88DRAFT_157254 [Tribonema minus]